MADGGGGSGDRARVLTGRAASPGLVRGRVYLARAQKSRIRVKGSPQEEEAALKAVLSTAASALEDLMAASDDPEAAAILEFQVEMLRDDALAEPAFHAIAQGDGADRAFAATIAEMAAEYAAADDEYFAARAADLKDIGDRVAGLLADGDDATAVLPADAVLIADDLTPSKFLEMAWSKGQGIALRNGSPTAHVAILARTRAIPMVVGLGAAAIDDGAMALLDATAGTLTLQPDGAAITAFNGRIAEETDHRRVEAGLIDKPAVTAEGEPVEVHLNIADPAELDAADPKICDGIGLVRTEFLFHGRGQLPDEEEQLAVYRRLLSWAEGKPVTIRTLDAGGDKPIPGLTIDEDNPFLGLRGVRLSLARPDIFRRQLRALLRAAAAGSLKIMLPMVAVPGEVEAVRTHLAECRAELEAEGHSIAPYALGIMVEVPAAAVALDGFAIDFASIGSNDLTQYIMAASRDSAAVAGLLDTATPAVLKTIAMTVDAAKANAIPLSLCGDAGGDPAVLPHLLATGLRSVSVAPARVGPAKRVIAAWRSPSGSPDHG